MKVLAILGASGHGKVVADSALTAGWDKIIFFDDAWPNVQKTGVWDVVGNTETLIQNKHLYDAAVIGIGNNNARFQKSILLEKAGITLAKIIHPSAVVSSFANIGPGTVVMAGVVINCDTVIGANCIINTNATVDHDCLIGNFVHISPGASLAGQVVINDSSWVGIGASIRQQIRVGYHVVIGAGSVIIKSIEDYSLVVGVPGKKIKNILVEDYTH